MRDSGARYNRREILIAGTAAVVLGLEARADDDPQPRFRQFINKSSAMEPTLRGPQNFAVADRFQVETAVSVKEGPKRGEIWVFRAPPIASPDEKEFVKRVIGLPGETVEMVPPRLLVDGKTALVLTNEGSGKGVDGVTIVAKPKIGATGATAEMQHRYSNTPLKVVADPKARPAADPYRVALNGQKLLVDKIGRIRETRGARSYGGDPVIRATAYTIDEELRLLVVRGSKLTYDPGHVRINGSRLDEKYIAEPSAYAMPLRKLKANEYFVLGDNRNNSNDSHAWGPLLRERFVGKAVYRYYPQDREGPL